MIILFYILLAFHLIIFWVVLYNLFTAPRIRNLRGDNSDFPSLSILIPARNEEKNIANLLDSLNRQSYKYFEIIVLDDNSDDKTNEIAASYLTKYNSMRIIKGKNLPSDWTGKNWACHQLSTAAKGDILLFIDADVTVKPEAISSSINLFKLKKIKMLSVFPTQLLYSYGEWLIVPLMNLILLALLPLKKVYSSKNKSFVAANGQFLMIERNAYRKIGGHERVKNKLVEDMEIARAMKKNNLQIMTALGADSIYCRMYEDLNSSVKGFTKNFYSGFNTNPLGFIILLLFISSLFLVPLILPLLNYYYFIIVLMIYITRIVISFLSYQKIFYNIILHPLQIIFMIVIGINSLRATLQNSIIWKSRKY